MSDVTKPAQIVDFTDFYASIEHATNARLDLPTAEPAARIIRSLTERKSPVAPQCPNFRLPFAIVGLP
jgi:hypothetical protein